MRQLLIACVFVLGFCATAFAGERKIVIYKGDQTFAAYEGGKIVRTGPVSTGRRSSWTPTGSFRVRGKEWMHYSRRYNNTPMPRAQHIVGNIFMHQGPLPDKAAQGYGLSHGCIRLQMSDAEWFYEWSRIGDRVIITNESS